MPDDRAPIKEDRIGLGGRIFNIVNRVLHGKPKVQRISRPGRKDRPPRVFAGGGLTTDDFETMYGFYSDRMRIGRKRTEIYEEVDSMDGDDLPAATLDQYAEDATRTDVATGKKVWLENCSETVRKIGEDLFDKLRAEERHEAIVRAMSKYGDLPVELWWEPGEGITYWRMYHPKFFKRFEEKGTGMLLGFYLGPDMENAQAINAQAHEIIHFRTMGSLSQMYGTSVLVSARRAFRRLRMSEDSAIMYRLQRHPTRDVYEIDVTGMTDEEASDYMRRFAEGIKKNKYFDEKTGDFRTDFNPWTATDDLFLPVVQGRQTKVERLAGSNDAMAVTDLEYYLARYHSAVRIPPTVFGYNVQGSVPYDSKLNLSAQDARYARIPAKLQHYYLIGMSRLLMLHMAFLGMDPYDEKNKFTLCMTPVSFLEEVHRQQLVEIRIDIMDRLFKLGDQVGFNVTLWRKYVLKEYGKLTDKMLEELLPEEAEVAAGAAAGEGVTVPPGGGPPTAPPPPGTEPTPGEEGTELPPPPEVPESVRKDVDSLLEEAANLALEERLHFHRLPSDDARKMLAREGGLPPEAKTRRKDVHSQLTEDHDEFEPEQSEIEEAESDDVQGNGVGAREED
jgi:hypothetical protein